MVREDRLRNPDLATFPPNLRFFQLFQVRVTHKPAGIFCVASPGYANDPRGPRCNLTDQWSALVATRRSWERTRQLARPRVPGA